MAYNHGKEERKWRLWKQTEEKQLRQLGVDESIIEWLRVHDWAVFNSERRYYQKRQETSTYIDEVAESVQQVEIRTVEDFLDSIEDELLYQVLVTVDKTTLEIVVMKTHGYSTADIAVHLRITEKSVYRRMDRLKEKIRKALEVKNKT